MQRERKNNTLSEVNSSKQLTSCTLALRTCGVRATLMHARARTATLISICPWRLDPTLILAMQADEPNINRHNPCRQAHTAYPRTHHACKIITQQMNEGESTAL